MKGRLSSVIHLKIVTLLTMSVQSFLRSHHSSLQWRPLVIGTLIGPAGFNSPFAQRHVRSVDLIEVRLDTYSFMGAPFSKALSLSIQLLKKIKQEFKKPILLTLRSYQEASQPVSPRKRLNDSKRLALLKPLLDFCDLIDVEIRHLALAKTITPLAHRKKVDVIHSFHDFKGPSRIEYLNQLLKASQRLGGDVFKAALTPRNNKDLASFLNWGKTVQKPLPVLIGMGPIGFVSRFVGFSFGSVLTYGHLGKSAAPGQISAGELMKSIRSIYRQP